MSDNLTKSGLQNLGNTCFINSIVQCLRHTKELRVVLLKHESSQSFAGTCARLIRAMQQSDVIVRPVSIVDQVQRDEKNDFESNSPGDSHEVLTYILNRIHADLSKRVKITRKSNDEQGSDLQRAAISAYKQAHEQAYSELLQIFYGQLLTTIIFKSDDERRTKNNFEAFLSLHLPIPDISDVTLYDCFDVLFSAEKLSDDNKFHDEDKGRYVDATKAHFVFKAPVILLLSLNRFSDISKKNMRHVKIPYHLNLEKYQAKHVNSRRYELSSVCHHVGRMDSGHCYSTCKDPADGAWYEYDDETVRKTDLEATTADSAYILFYRQRA